MCLNSPRQSATTITAYLDSPRQAIVLYGPSQSPRQSLTTISWEALSPRQNMTRVLAAEFVAAYVAPTSAGTLLVPHGFRALSDSPRQARTIILYDSPRQSVTEITP